MHLAEIISDMRKKQGLTQDDLAERLYVTRQAVSRWENGETTPGLETLKRISELFSIPANTLLGLSETPVCQSCSMPLAALDDFGTNADETANTEFCSHCYRGGGFTHNRTLEEMVEANLRFLAEFNAQNGTSYNEAEARDILKLHLATLSRWRN